MNIKQKRIFKSQAEYLVLYEDGIETWQTLSQLSKENKINIVRDFEVKQRQNLSFVVGSYEKGHSIEEVIGEIRKDKLYTVKWKQVDPNVIIQQSTIRESELLNHDPELLAEFLLKNVTWKMK